MEFDPKTALSVLLGLAGALRTIGELAEAVNAIAGHVLDDPELEQKVPPAIKLDGIADLCVLLAELEASAARLQTRSPILRRMQREHLRQSRAASARSMAQPEQDEVTAQDEHKESD